MAKKKLTPEQEKEIKLLQANNEMLENTKKEVKLRGNETTLKRIEIAQQDVISQIAKIDEDIANDTQNGKKIQEEKPKVKKEATVFEQIEQMNKKKNEDPKPKANKVKKTTEETSKKVTTKPIEKDFTVKKELKMNENVFNTIPSDIQYDIISLPSNGECYANKIGRIPVGYLTAYDENFLTSPNLYQDGLVIDFLLKNKILDPEFDIDNMCRGDADAVILFLRATSYGADFPIAVRDPETRERFETSVDLTTFKNKEFNLEGDENGYFTYILPITKAEIKFKYLTRKEEKVLDLLNDYEGKNGRSIMIREMQRKLRVLLDEEEDLSQNETEEIESLIDKLNNWAEIVGNTEDTYVSRIITNRMEMNIVSINGNTDREYISKYIKQMPVRDSFALRKYIGENEPGIDWTFKVEKPESLGGGSFETFLNWDDSIFFNIS